MFHFVSGKSSTCYLTIYYGYIITHYCHLQRCFFFTVLRASGMRMLYPQQYELLRPAIMIKPVIARMRQTARILDIFTMVQNDQTRSQMRLA